MTSDALLVIQCLFTNIWSLFTSWKIPGTNVTPGMWALFALFFVFVIKFVIPGVLGLGLSVSDGGGKSSGSAKK